MKKIVLVISVLLFIACKNQNIKEYVPEDDQYLVVHADSGSHYFPDKGMYKLEFQYITQKEFDSLKYFSYEMEHQEIDLKSAKARELIAMAQNPSTEIGKYLKKILNDGEDADYSEPAEIIGISYYKQTDQYEVKTYYIGDISFMAMGNKADTTIMDSQGSSYAKNGIYAGFAGQDCDFRCDIQFYLFDKSSKRMVYVGQYINYHWAFEEFGGENNNGSIKWIAPNKLLCKGFRDVCDESWEWNDSISKIKDYKGDRTSRYGDPVYSLITLTKKNEVR
jgi:hypothetical protein